MAEPIQPTTNKQPQAQTPNKKQLPPHYVLNIEGTFVQGKEEKPYKVEVKVPHLGEGKADTHYLTAVLSPKYGNILKKAIIDKHGHCEYIHTHALVSREFVDEKGNKTPAVSEAIITGGEGLTIHNMKKAELENLIKEKQYTIDLAVYNTVDKMRKAIVAYTEDKEAFLAQQEKDKEENRIKSQLEDLI